MEIKVFIVSLACLSCLVPPALGKAIMVKALAGGAAKGAVVAGLKGAAIGVGLGVAAKGALAFLTKKLLLGILLKAAAIKGGAVVAKKAAIKGVGAIALKGLKGAMLENERNASSTDSSESEDGTTTPRTALRELLSGTARAVQSTLRLGQAAAMKSRAIYRILSAVPRMLDPTLSD